MIVLDTDHISLLQHRDSSDAEKLQRRLEDYSPRQVSVSAPTLEVMSENAYSDERVS